MTLRKIRIQYGRATVLIVLLTLAMIAAVSLIFEVWSFPWIAWCALGLLAIVIIPCEVLQVMPSDTDAPLSDGWYYALCLYWATFTAAIADAPSFSWLIIMVGGLAAIEDIIRLAIGPVPSPDDELQGGDND